MGASMSSPGNGHNSNPESRVEIPLDEVLRKSIMDHATACLHGAFKRQMTSGDIFVTDASEDVGFENAAAVLLTRDGIPPLYYENKEHIYLYFPLLERDEIAKYTEFPIVWVEDKSFDGKWPKLTLTLDDVSPTIPVTLESPKNKASRKWFQTKMRAEQPQHDQDNPNGIENLRRLRAKIDGYVITRQASAAA